jgi:hypothetical protein
MVLAGLNNVLEMGEDSLHSSTRDDRSPLSLQYLEDVCEVDDEMEEKKSCIDNFDDMAPPNLDRQKDLLDEMTLAWARIAKEDTKTNLADILQQRYLDQNVND